MMKPSRIFSFVCASAIIGYCLASRSACDPQEVTSCIMQYTKDIVRYAMNPADLCRYKYKIGENLKACKTVSLQDCDESIRSQYDTIISMTLSSNNIYDAIYCKPAPGCSVFDIYDCIADIVTELGITLPKTNEEKLGFIANFSAVTMFHTYNPSKYCEIMTSQRAMELEQCSIEKSQHLMSCLTDQLQNSGSVVATAVSTMQTIVGEMVKNIAKGNVTVLINQQLCQGRCPEFDAKMNGIKICAKNYALRSLDLQLQPSLAQMRACGFMSDYLNCIQGEADNCDALQIDLKQTKAIDILETLATTLSCPAPSFLPRQEEPKSGPPIFDGSDSSDKDANKFVNDLFKGIESGKYNNAIDKRTVK